MGCFTQVRCVLVLWVRRCRAIVCLGTPSTLRHAWSQMEKVMVEQFEFTRQTFTCHVTRLYSSDAKVAALHPAGESNGVRPFEAIVAARCGPRDQKWRPLTQLDKVMECVAFCSNQRCDSHTLLYSLQLHVDLINVKN